MRYLSRSLWMTAVLALWASHGSLSMASEFKNTYTPEIYFVGVDGDEDKFKAHHWMGTGVDGGLSSYEFKSEDSKLGLSLDMDGRIIADNGEYETNIKIAKEDAFTWAIGYDQFRKYYESDGKTYQHFSALRSVDSMRDLFLDIGKFNMGLEILRPDFPIIDLGYEYEFKEGTKSRTAYGTTTESSSKKTLPSWMDLDENVHTFDVGLKHEWLGYSLDFDQSWQHVQSDSRLHTEAMTTYTEQDKSPKSDSIRSTAHVDRWFQNRTIYGGLGYRYYQLENYELENIYNYSKATNFFSGGERVLNATSTNQYNTHAVTANVMKFFGKWLTAGGKFKAELLTRDSESAHPVDTTTNGSVDQIDFSKSSDAIKRFGEGISLRYTGLAKAAFFSDTEAEQSFGGLNENRLSNSDGEQVYRETDYLFYRFAESIGMQLYPLDWLNMTAQYRFRKDNLDYDDQNEAAITTRQKSAFMDGGRHMSNEIAFRTTLYPNDWVRPSFRYQIKSLEHTWYTELFGLDVTTETFSHVYSADLMLQPIQDLVLNGSVSIQMLSLQDSPASKSSLPYPSNNGDVATWFLGADYFVRSGISVASNMLFQKSANYSEAFSAVSLPYLVDYERLDASIGLKLTELIHGATVEPKYSYYSYSPREDVDDSAYKAHVVWLSIKMPWG